MKKLFRDRKVLSWALYDWANSAFATTIISGFFPVFYSNISQDLSTSDSQFWFNITLAVSSLLVALAAPVLGAIADYGGRRKRFLAVFTLLGILMSAGLAWSAAGMWWMALLIYGLGQVGFSGANVFYDAMIVDVSEEEDFDVVSGYGYALGYIGGGLLFLINVIMVTQPQLFGFSGAGQAVSWAFISVGVWWAVFSIPLMMNVDEAPARSHGAGEAIRQGFRELRVTLGEVRKLRVVGIFLISYWLYIDGVGTIARVAVFFGDRILGLPSESLIVALLVTQFVAFPAALFFGWLGKRIGARTGIFICIAVYLVVVFYAWRWLNTALDFYWLAASVGLVQGGIQSLSRSLFARMIPRSRTTEFFGFYNMVGKFASIFGPFLMALAPLMFAGMGDRDTILVLVVLFVGGGLCLCAVDVDKGVAAARELDRGPRRP